MKKKIKLLCKTIIYRPFEKQNYEYRNEVPGMPGRRGITFERKPSEASSGSNSDTATDRDTTGEFCSVCSNVRLRSPFPFAVEVRVTGIDGNEAALPPSKCRKRTCAANVLFSQFDTA